MWGTAQWVEVKAFHWPEASWTVMLRPLAPYVWLNDRRLVILSCPEREGMLLACGVWGTDCCWSSRAHNRECPDLRGVRVETACFVITELISCWLIEFVFEGIMRRNSKMLWARLFFWAPGQHTLPSTLKPLLACSPWGWAVSTSFAPSLNRRDAPFARKHWPPPGGWW